MTRRARHRGDAGDADDAREAGRWARLRTAMRRCWARIRPTLRSPGAQLDALFLQRHLTPAADEALPPRLERQLDAYLARNADEIDAQLHALLDAGRPAPEQRRRTQPS